MFNVGKETALRHAMAARFISHDHARRILKTFQQPSKETFGGISIASLLHENVRHDTVLVDGAPEMVLHSLDPNEPLASRPGEFHPQALPEPCMNLSIHTAPDVRPLP